MNYLDDKLIIGIEEVEEFLLFSFLGWNEFIAIFRGFHFLDSGFGTFDYLFELVEDQFFIRQS
jgi:hypothetical protein